jgi:DNA-binding CsgD family transcriptional regulator
MRGRKDTHYRGVKETFCVHPKTFIFFDKTTRTQRFEVKAHADGSMPAQEAASLLAMQCVMHGQTPQDFAVVVPIGGDLPNGLGRRARRLIEACVAMHSDVLLSQRQHEVLRLLLQDLANKEIAVELRIGVRTVKFHVSALLAKFGVADRGCLGEKTRELMTAGTLPAKLTFVQQAPQKGPGEPRVRNSRESPLRLNVLQKQSSG